MHRITSLLLWILVSLTALVVQPARVGALNLRSSLRSVVSPSRTSGAFSDFRSGDLVFQTTRSRQSYAIMWASKSLYSHVGLIERQGKDIYVLEAVGHVSRTPLATWLRHGRGQRFSVYRDPRLSDMQRTELVAAARQLLGRPYDLHFTSGNEAVYCSELVALAYQALSVPVGRWQQVSELDVDNPLVRKLAQSRWRKHPKCKDERDFDACWSRLQHDALITPAALAEDNRLQRVYSNYPL